MARTKVFDKTSGSWIYADKSFGKDGKTPVKGVDYFDGKDYVLTDADKKEIAELAADLVEVPESPDSVQEVFIGTTGTHYNEYLRHYEKGKLCYLKHDTGDLLLTHKTTTDGTLLFEGYSSGALRQYQLSSENRWTFINNSFTREISESSTNAQIPSAKAVYDAMQNMGGSGGNADFIVSDTPPEDTSVLWVDPSDDTEEDFGGISITGAKVGQTVKIAAVDSEGVPTKWASTDIVGGCEVEVEGKALVFSNNNDAVSGNYELIDTIVTTEEVAIEYTQEPNGKPYNFSAASIRVKKAENATVPNSLTLRAITSSRREQLLYLPPCTRTAEQWGYAEIKQYKGFWGRERAADWSIYNYTATPMLVKIPMYDNQVRNGETIVKITGTSIPSGLTIEIWGVRA